MIFSRKEYEKQYYQDHKEHMDSANKEWVNKNRERSNAIKRKYKQTGKGRVTAIRTREKNKKHIFARNKIDYLVNCGKVERGTCALCGSSKNVEAHHENYDEPYVIIWLCKKHHDIVTEQESSIKTAIFNDISE